MKSSKNILLFILILTGISTYGQTYVSGGIFANTTWTINGSPYIVIGDIAIYPNRTLTVEAGTIIKFDSATTFYVRGTLQLNGEEDQKIILTSNTENPSMSDWNGIQLENQQGGKIIGNYFQASYADRFINIVSVSDGEIISISNSNISYCDFAFYGTTYTSDFTISLVNDTLTDNNHGFVFGQNMTILNSVICNGNMGVHSWEYGSNNNTFKNTEFFNLIDYSINVVSGLVDSCHIHNNGIGIRMKPILDVRNSIIEENVIGILCQYPVPVPGEIIYDNIIRNNTSYNFEHTQSYPINIPSNCWGSSDPEEIGQTIYDAYDDVSLGIVTFTPFNTDCIPTNIDKDIKKNQKFIYPNPANDYIFIKSRTKVFYKIISVNGCVVLEGYTTNKIDISSLDKGLYFIRVIETSGNENQNTYKIFKL